MTSEVAILNKQGAALAADSAATVQIKRGSSNQNQKIYNSANKLFALSKHAPVGIMISNQADFGFIPWETVIKEFRETLGKKSYASFDSYVTRFKDFIISSSLFSESENFDLQQNLSTALQVIFDELEKAEKALFSTGQQVPAAAIKTSNTDCISRLKQAAENRLSQSAFGKTDISLLRRRHSRVLTERYSALFKNRPISQRQRSTILNCASIFALLPGIVRTTIAIAGFGDKEVLPSIVEIGAFTRFNGKMQLSESKNTVTPQNPAFVKAFAQNAEVAAFLSGISNPLRNLIYKTLEKTLTEELPNKIAATIAASIGNLTQQQLSQLDNLYRGFGKSAQSSFVTNINNYIQNQNVTEIMRTVSTLPLSQLAEMAEALVNLESFKKQVSFQDETVGGPVDVAVISKGDGLIWIKRKHYFEPQLNYQYFSSKYPAGGSK